MKINDILKLKYPDANFRKDIILRDDGDGVVYIKEWNLTDPKPTQADLDQWQIDCAQAYIFKQNAEINKVVYAQLDAIDIKSIRALRTNDTVRLASLEAQASSLRTTLLPVA